VLLAATANNIKKLLRYNGENSLTAKAKNTTKELLNVLYQSYRLILRHLKSLLANQSTISIISILPDSIFENQNTKKKSNFL
jgi:hypothetical protein